MRLISIIAGVFFALAAHAQTVLPINGGTGIRNANTKTITLGGPLTTTGTISVTGQTGTGNLVAATGPAITQIVPGADFSISQNSVTPFVTVNTSAVASTLVLKAGNVGIGTATPTDSVGYSTPRFIDISNNGIVGVLLHDTATTQQGGVVSTGAGIFYEVSGHATAAGNNAHIFRVGDTDASYSLTEKLRVRKIGIEIGGTAARGTTEPTNALNVFNGTAPVGTLTNGATFYAASGEMRVMDSAGNSTLLSPHCDHALAARGLCRYNDWIMDTTSATSGKRLVVEMERMLKALNKRLGGGFVHELPKPKGG